MNKRRRFCPQGHDTFAGGRDQSYRCLECKRLGAAESLARSREAKLAQERADEAKRRAAEDKRREKEWAAERARIVKAGGPELLELLQLECNQERCCWIMSEDPPAVCGRKNGGDWSVYCRKHNRQLDREHARPQLDVQKQPGGTDAPMPGSVGREPGSMRGARHEAARP